ncbi:class I SAM-dependent methyltransferase [Streptomyces sp. NPDC008313]|uniref:class I SAM-dependent methyltransferase n=1 Tax=Streptomyces sp. NPDC008313 TaxID=3364826 RepID=UPI0036DFB184
MVDRSFGDASLAPLYDPLNPWGPGDDFCLDLVMSARSVLDVGCGTGRLLARARQDGHRGRLCGLDPAAAMLVRARQARDDVEWMLGDLASARWAGEFDLVVMTGHAFQTLTGDDELRSCLTAVREALTDDGRFLFETRNPAARAWENWTGVREVTDADGGAVRVRYEVEEPVAGERVTFTETFEHPGWEGTRVSRSTLRFLGPGVLDGFLAESGLTVRKRFGDWGREPFAPAPGTDGPASPEIITIAGRADG